MIFEELKEELIKSNSIDNYYYEHYKVNRGLRQKNGSGVVAGLTSIGSVIGIKTTGIESIEPIDGELKYRGKNIVDIIQELSLTGKYWYEKVVFLLLVGRFPNKQEIKQLIQFFSAHRYLPENTMYHIIKGIPSKSIMNKLEMAIASLFSEDSNPNSLDPYENFIKSLNIIAKVPAIVAYSYLNYHQDNPEYVIAPDGMSIAESFLYMIRQGAHYTKLEQEILDLCLVLHAEHGGGNNSTFTCKVITSSGSDIYSALIGAIGSLKGPLHGSANEKVMDMMNNIKINIKNWADEDEIVAYLKKILTKKAYNKTGKIYGLGHAVYTKSDPRALILKEKAELLAKEKNRQKELELYKKIEEFGPRLFNQIKKSEKLISPNVDFYSGFVYDCLEIPVHVYTPMFAMARIVGWCAHRIEEILSGKRIIRPGYKYIEIIPE